MSDYKVWECQICGWHYDEHKGCPEEGLSPGTRWEDVPGDWCCPECGVGKEDFDMVEVQKTAHSAPLPTPTPFASIAHTPSPERPSAPVVIIGSGMAGYHLARELRRIAPDLPVVMFTTDDGTYYSKPMLSAGFSANKSATDLASQSAEEMATQLDIEVNIFTPVASINAESRTLTLQRGGTQSYSKLVLATGASCIPPPFDGEGMSKVHQVNDLLDYAKFRTAVKPGSQILVIGAGLIGSEYADDLTRAGHKITVVDPLPGALATLLPQQASSLLTDKLSEAGITFKLGHLVRRVDHRGSGIVATLEDGCSLAADRVLCAIGIRPDLTLAKTAGLETNKGIVVGSGLQTSNTDIFAIGDCAEVSGTVLPYIAPLTAQVKALAHTLAGKQTRVSYGVMPVMVKTKLHPVVVNPPPHQDGEWILDYHTEKGVKARFIASNGALLGYALTGDQCKENAKLMRLCSPLI